MAVHEVDCLVCGRPFKDYDAAPRFFCSVGCAADAGPVEEKATPLDPPSKGRAVKTYRPKWKAPHE
jgi:hypothetical protein